MSKKVTETGARPPTLKVTIKCQGCEKTHTLRPRKVQKCDGYYCGTCGFSHPTAPQGHVTEILFQAAGNFWGYRIILATPDHIAAQQRAKDILQRGLQRLENLN